MLAGIACTLDGRGCASDYAQGLLTALGAAVHRTSASEDTHPALAWAQSGAMALTGRCDGPPQMCPAPLASCVDGVAAAFAAIAQIDRRNLPGAAVLGERAALSGLQRNGTIAPGGACRLLRSADGWLAVNLPRPDDWQLLPAWLEGAEIASDDWAGLAARLRAHPNDRLLERGRLLGLAVAAATTETTAAATAPEPLSWHVVSTRGQPRVAAARGQPLVVDLSALWAGPLCSHLLQLAGMHVVKVESRQRPDGARRGPAEFHDLLNHGKASVALDFADPHAIEQLRQLLRQADIVIEASRPRALRQLGIDAEALVATTPGLTWISISGYGRDAGHENRIAYGDDAGVAAGLSGLLLDVGGEPLFCGDAIADPLTGWHAALAALASQRSGGGRLIALALRDVVRHCLRHTLPPTMTEIRARWLSWSAQINPAQIAAPHARVARGAARPLGADTAAVLAGLNIPC